MGVSEFDPDTSTAPPPADSKVSTEETGSSVVGELSTDLDPDFLEHAAKGFTRVSKINILNTNAMDTIQCFLPDRQDAQKLDKNLKDS